MVLLIIIYCSDLLLAIDIFLWLGFPVQINHDDGSTTRLGCSAMRPRGNLSPEAGTNWTNDWVEMGDPKNPQSMDG